MWQTVKKENTIRLMLYFIKLFCNCSGPEKNRISLSNAHFRDPCPNALPEWTIFYARRMPSFLIRPHPTNTTTNILTIATAIDRWYNFLHVFIRYRPLLMNFFSNSLLIRMINRNVNSTVSKNQQNFLQFFQKNRGKHWGKEKIIRLRQDISK